MCCSSWVRPAAWHRALSAATIQLTSKLDVQRKCFLNKRVLAMKLPEHCFPLRFAQHALSHERNNKIVQNVLLLLLQTLFSASLFILLPRFGFRRQLTAKLG